MKFNDKEYTGLTSNEVETLIKAKKVNKSKKIVKNTHLSIILSSIFTLPNVILYIVGLFFLYAQLFIEDGFSYIPVTKYGFLFVILFNIIISIASKEKSKITLDKMKVISKGKVEVIRNNEIILVNDEDIVLGDYLFLDKSNFTLPVDLELIDGEATVNESVLSGESNLIKKKTGDNLLSGSILIYGKCIGKVIRVGKDTFVNNLETKVKSIKKSKSLLNKDINKIILIMLILAFPAVGAVNLSTYIYQKGDFLLNSISNSSTIIVGMVPIGLVLLSSVTLANSIIKLIKQNILTKELYAIESLARVDTLCVDKTGTLTTNHMKVKEIKAISKTKTKEYLNNLLYYYLSNLNDSDTSISIKSFLDINKIELDKFKEESNLIIEEKMLFDSTKKYSSLKIDGKKYYFGAFDYLLDKNLNKDIYEYALNLAKKGNRVLVFKDEDEVLSLIYLVSELRKNVKETIAYFNELKIDIKVISGDNLETVKEIAKESGILNYDNAISLENVSIEELKNIYNKYSIFARAKPEQKEEIVRLLEENNHKVAYIGDGVNDITSLRRATSSIALNSGVTSSKIISDFTLLDDDFSSLPNVIKEGRRVLKNIERTCTLFIVKDTLIFLYALYSLVSKNGMVIGIESIYIFEFIIVALSGFLLSIENTISEKYDNKMLKRSFLLGGISGLFLSLPGLIIGILSFFIEIPGAHIMCSLLISLFGPLILFGISYPLSRYSKIVLIISSSLTLFGLFFAPNIFLNPFYLRDANNLLEQLELIFKSFFNLEIYTKLNYVEYISLGVYFTITSSIFIFLVIKYKKKLISKAQSL